MGLAEGTSPDLNGAVVAPGSPLGTCPNWGLRGLTSDVRVRGHAVAQQLHVLLAALHRRARPRSGALRAARAGHLRDRGTGLSRGAPGAPTRGTARGGPQGAKRGGRGRGSWLGGCCMDRAEPRRVPKRSRPVPPPSALPAGPGRMWPPHNPQDPEPSGSAAAGRAFRPLRPRTRHRGLPRPMVVFWGDMGQCPPQPCSPPSPACLLWGPGPGAGPAPAARGQGQGCGAKATAQVSSTGGHREGLGRALAPHCEGKSR